MNQMIRTSRTPEAAMAEVAMRAAAEYLARHSLTADPVALTECLKAHLKAALPIALADAKRALDARMEAVALQTFEASLALAGIEAAKEAGFPRARWSRPVV